MIVHFDRSFGRCLEKLQDDKIKNRLKRVILKLEKAKSISEIQGVKQLKGHHGFFRIRIGDYRLGLELLDPDNVLLILILHRKDIYKRFP